MNGKQKTYLRSLANTIKPVFQIGKDGINDNMLTDVRNYLNKNELMKISLLQNCPIDKEEAADIFENCGFEIIQIIGSVIVLYKKSKNAKNPIILP